MNNDPTSTFNRLRPRLQGIAYRMLGSPAEAEDVVQDAWLRWHKAPHGALDSSEAWLVTVTTRLAIDRLRSAKQQREHYVGTWLPEPELSGSPPTPEQMLERADDVSVAFLALLERLAPEARAAFLLREVFDADYGEVAQTLGKTESACRQIVHRAKAQLQDDRPRHSVPRDAQLRLLRGFADAASSGQFGARPAHRPAVLRHAPALWRRGALRGGGAQRPVGPAALHPRRPGVGAIVRDRRRTHPARACAAQPGQARAHRRRAGPRAGCHTYAALNVFRAVTPNQP
jgi:RNA polymerase sigma factor (sigma-70 family)